MSKNKKQLITLAVLAAVLLAPALWRGASNVASEVYSQLAASVGISAQAYGEKLGDSVHHAVLNIRAHVPNSHITHADVLSIMCVENAGLNANVCASAGDCGLTQVIEGTFNMYVNRNAGNCGYIRTSFSGSVSHSNLSNPRLSIEVGACIFNDALRKCGGDRSCAYHIYNSGRKGGSPYVNRFNTCYEHTRIGKQFQKIGSTIWGDLIKKVSELTGGTFKTEDALNIPISASGWSSTQLNPQEHWKQITSGWQNSSLGQLFGGQSGLGGGSGGGSSSGYQSGYQSSSSGTQQQSGSTHQTSNSWGSSTGDTDENYTNIASTESDPTSSDSSSANSTYLPGKPLLNCLPNIVIKDEPALIFWQCRDGADTALLSESATGQASELDPAGKARVSPSETTEYKLTCGSSSTSEQVTSATCNIEVIDPALALISSKKSVPMWESVNLSWSSIDTQGCELNSDDNNSKHVDWRRYGSSGDVLSHAITKETVFTLTCTTVTGMQKEKSVVVTIE